MLYSLLFILLASLNASSETVKEYEVMPLFNGKPRILVIGDSISLGHTPYLEEKLTDYQVIHSPGNAMSSAYGATHIEKWASSSDTWEICLLNHGLHDIFDGKKTPHLDYLKHIGHELNVLAKNCKRRMFLTSTVVPRNTIGRKNEDVVIYNTIIKSFLETFPEVKICDLYQKSETIPYLYKNAEQQNNVHFTVWGDERLATYILQCMKHDFPEMFQ